MVYNIIHLCHFLRWWKTGQCAAFSSTQVSGTQSLTMSKVAGVFVVLCVGMVLGLTVAVLEYSYRTHQKQAKNRNRVSSGWLKGQ